MVRQVVILAGGLGTRLGALTAHTPKPMVLVGGRPFLDIMLEEVGSQGFQEILLLTGYRSDVVYDRYEGTVWKGAHVRCVPEASPLGTGGALVNAAHFLDERFVMMNGDTFFDINLHAFTSAAIASDATAMLALRRAEGERYGSVEWDGDRIHSFTAQGKGGYINGGIYVLKKSILDSIKSVPASIEANIFPVLADNHTLHGRSFDNFFIDIGIPEALAEAQRSVPAQVTRPALFFDRDGVLNLDKNYVHKQADFEWREGAVEAIKYLNDARWLVIVVTNQAGVARGYYREEQVHALHAWMNEHLSAHGAHINAFYYCPHHPEGTLREYTQPCQCRKPAPGMLAKAREEWAIDTKRSFLIGDKESDVAAAEAFGIQGKLIFPQDNLLDMVTQGVGTYARQPYIVKD